MPELPEVETIKNDLKKMILNKKIADVLVHKKKIVKNSYNIFLKELKGNVFKNISRIGKLIIFHLKSGQYLLIHLKMTGQLIYCSKNNCITGGHEVPGMDDKLPNKYSHVIFSFSDKSTLYFNDMRQFGYLKIVNKNELEKIKSKYGIEPLTKNYTLDNFKKIFQGRRISVKAVLLNQNLVSGIGNIYADEILFKSGIRPTRIASCVKEDEIKKMFKAIELILKKAIKYRGTTFSDYVDSRGKKGNFTKLLKVYGRDGKKCFRCNGVVKKIKLAGRGTRYCPKCQL